MKIGTLLRKLRDSIRISSRDIAKKIDVSHSTYMDWEHDKTSPTLKSYIKIANAFEVNPVDLMSYLTGQSSHVLSSEETSSLAELKEMVTYLRNHNSKLMQDHERTILEIQTLKKMNLKLPEYQ